MRLVLAFLWCIIQFVAGVPQQPFSDVFTRNSEGFQCYRVPALLVTQKGTLLAFAEGRNGTTSPDTCSGDDGSTSKGLALKRSFDNGVTWSKLQVVGITTCGGGFECGYPSAVQDSKSGRIFVLFGGKPGIQIAESDDEGATWTQFKPLPSFYTLTSASPGHGIQIDSAMCGSAGESCPSNRLIVPSECSHMEVPMVCLLYSDDGGNTWNMSEPGQVFSRESECVQIQSKNESAVVYCNSRNFNNPGGVRLTSWSLNGGTNFSEFGQDNSLIEPVNSAWKGVVASTTRLSANPSRILFSDPDCATARMNMTVRMSLNDASTWQYARVIDAGPSAYSDLGRISDSEAGILYERGTQLENYDHITFVPFNVSWLQGVGSIPDTAKVIHIQ